MSHSRWDALKPNETRSSRNRSQRQGFRKQNFKDSRNVVPKKEKQSWQTHPSNQEEKDATYNGRFKKSPSVTSSTRAWRPKSLSSGANNDSNPPSEISSDWERWTKAIIEWCKKVQSNQDSSKNAVAENEALLPALRALSNLLAREHKNIDGIQKGRALTSALHALELAQKSSLVGEVIDFCHAIFSSAAPGDCLNKLHSEIQMTTGQAQECLDRLKIAKIEEDHHIQFLQCFMMAVMSFASMLPPEETAHRSVNGILLPAIEESLDLVGNTQEPVDNKSQLELLHLELQALHTLLNDRRHASALLAPLVKDVSVDGKEEYLPNPLRMQIFKVLERCLLLGRLLPQHDLELSVFKCLKTALEMANAVDKSSKIIATKGEKLKTDLDMTFMAQFFSEQLTLRQSGGKGRRQHILELLMVYLRKHPDGSLSIAKSLLLEGKNASRHALTTTRLSYGSQCTFCGDSGGLYSGLLQLLHEAPSLDERETIMASLSIMIANIPWGLWLGTTSPQQKCLSPRGCANSNFTSRVSVLVRSIIRIATCQIRSAKKSFVVTRHTCQAESLANFLRATLLELPFNVDQEILDSGRGLLEAMAALVLNVEQISSVLLGKIVDALEECMGGRITPNGLRTDMVVPAKVWLESSSGFLDRLLSYADNPVDGVTYFSGGVKVKVALRLLRAIIRTRPETVLDTAYHWNAFKDLIQQQSRSEDTQRQLNCLQLLEALLEGRMYTTTHKKALASNRVADLAFSLLPRMSASHSGQCRSLCFQAYGCLLDTDWFRAPSVDAMMHHVVLILNFSGKKESVAAVRSSACKAAGDFCSNCFLESEAHPDLIIFSSISISSQQRQDFLRKTGPIIAAAMLEATRGGNASVRSMALFSLGNLAQVVANATKFNEILATSTIREACQASNAYIGDENDKVAGNAIRSLGHFGSIILRDNCHHMFDESEWDVDSFVNQCVLSLAAKVETAVAVVSGKNSGGMSWKQRSTAKKHGRVACNSLALIFIELDFSDASSPEKQLESCKVALISVVDCIDCLGTPFDEKMLIASMRCMCALPSPSLARVSGKTGLVGKALVSCIVCIARKRSSSEPCFTSGKLLVQVEILCEHLMNSASILDATIVLSCEEIADSWLGQLHDWMVARNCSGRAFDAFALAIQRPGLAIPVSIERKFANKALNLLRHYDNDDIDSDDEI